MKYVMGIAGPRRPSRADPEKTPAPIRRCRNRACRRRPTAGVAAEAYQMLSVQGLPLIKPPYSTISAINVDRGEIVWQTAARRYAGQRPQPSRAEGSQTNPKTGQMGYNIGTLVTKTLVIAGDGQVTTTPDHPRGAMLRAYDKATGKRWARS